MRLCHVIPMVLAGVAFTPLAYADDVSDQIDKAAAAWRAHDSQGAIVALEAAANLVRQARADLLTTLLPPPPPGWTADAAETGTVSVAMLGGGTSASRTYHNGAQQVQVQITTDSPMLQSMAALASSPLASAAGVRTVMIGDRSVAYTASDNSYMTLIGNKIIVKVDGTGDTPEPTVRSFVALIDFNAVERLTH
jgi:hypothetical protein